METYLWFAGAGVIAAVVALLRSELAKKPRRQSDRLLDALLCGFGAFALCGIAWRLYPDKVTPQDAIFLGPAIGAMGVGKLYDVIFDRFKNVTGASDDKK